MNQLQKVFNYQENPVRIIVRDGEPWWVLKDVCDVLGLSNPTIVASRLDTDEVTKFGLGGLSGESNIVSESGLYNVILRSDKPEAKAFKRWITHEVLPAIRKTGTYSIALPRTYAEALRALADEVEIKERLLIENAAMKPKATYYDLVLQNKNLLSVTKIAKDYGMSATALNKILAEEKVQFKQGDCWILYQRYAEQGYTQSKTQIIDEAKTKLHTYWTQKGRLFIYDLLKNRRGILPVMERQIAS